MKKFFNKYRKRLQKLTEAKMYIYHGIFIISAILYIGRVIDFHFLTHYINGNDTFQWLNFVGYIKSGLFIWDVNPAGRLEPMAFTPVLYNSFLEIIYTFLHQTILTINMYWIISVYLLQVTFFYFYKLFFNNLKAYFATLLSLINISVILVLYYPLVYVDYVGIMAFPLMFLLLYKYISENKFIYVLAYSIFQLFLFRTINILLLANLLVPLLVFIFYQNKTGSASFLRKVLFTWFLSLVMCIPLIINSGVTFGNIFSNRGVETYNQFSLSNYYTDRYDLSNTFRLTNQFSIADKYQEFPGLLYYDFSQIYMRTIPYIFIAFIPFIALLLGLIIGKRDKFKVVLLIFLVIFIFLAKSLNPPLIFLNQLLYSNKVYSLFFRSGPKYFMFIIIPLLVLQIFLNIKKSKLAYSLLILYLFAHIILIFVLFKPIGKYWNTVVPKGDLEMTNEIHKLKDNDRILLLPISSNMVGETIYKDNYSGVSRLELLSPNKSFITKNFFTTTSDGYINILNSISSRFWNNNLNSNALDKNSEILGYRYLVLEKSVVYYTSPNVNNKVFYTDKIEKAIRNKQWTKIYENSLSTLYKIKDNLFKGKIRAANVSVDYQYVNPTTYKIYIHNLKNKTQLSFIESYSPGWNLYLEKNPGNSWCSGGDYFELSKTKECYGGSRTFDFKSLSFLFRQPVFESSHSIENSFSNKWQLDPDFVIQHFNSNYYKVNSGGGIDMELTLYLKPQSYYFLGLLISGFVIFLSFIWVIFGVFKEYMRKR